jgi:hypothetical protein
MDWYWWVLVVGPLPLEIWVIITQGRALLFRGKIVHPVRSRLDWCVGCDQIRPPGYMAFTEQGQYWCALCRGKPEPPTSTPRPIAASLHQALADLSCQGVIPPNMMRATVLNPHIIAGLRAHLKFSPQDRKDLIEKWGTSWLPEESRCWDCDRPYQGPVGRCPSCAERFAQRLAGPVRLSDCGAGQEGKWRNPAKSYPRQSCLCQRCVRARVEQGKPKSTFDLVTETSEWLTQLERLRKGHERVEKEWKDRMASLRAQVPDGGMRRWW